MVISTMLEGDSDPFPVLQVDSRLIEVNGKDAVLEKAAEITEVSRRRRRCRGIFSQTSYM